jgi:FixJ family two-component response regulator
VKNRATAQETSTRRGRIDSASAKDNALSRIRVAVIDDEQPSRTSLARMLQSAGIDVHAFSSASEFLSDPAAQHCDCVVSDVLMPGVNGLKLQHELRRSSPYLCLILISGFADIAMTRDALKGGAVDFLQKPVKYQELMAAITGAAERSRSQRAAQQRMEELRRRWDLLTARQRQVFRMVASGLLNKQIGFELGTAERTVKMHRAKVMKKMQAASAAELVSMAISLGIGPGVGEGDACSGQLRRPVQ